jgi:FeS assembly SUF system protein
MPTEPTKTSLPQVTDHEDHVAKIMREKLGGMFDRSVAKTATPKPAEEHSSLAPDQVALERKIIATLQTIFDPEIPLNIYDLGLIYKITIAPTNAVKIDMTLTAPGCPVAGDIVASVKNKIAALPEVPTADVELVWDPPWTRDRLSEAARLELGLM